MTTGSEKVAIARAPSMQAKRKMRVALGSAQVMRECNPLHHFGQVSQVVLHCQSNLDEPQVLLAQLPNATLLLRLKKSTVVSFSIERNSDSKPSL